MSPLLTTGQILRQFLPAYRERHQLTPQQARVTGLLCQCRTDALGGFRLACDHCDYHTERYCSCRNRHCPQCQKQATDQWLAARREDLLPVPYFHLVFTLPHRLNPWIQCHPDVVYGLLFKAVWHTLSAFGRDPKRLDGQLGMTAVLHTWGQNLSRHVHLHCLIPAGAFQAETHEWHPAKSTYLFPVKALSRHFRGRMVHELRTTFEAGQLPRLSGADEVRTILDQLMTAPWVVFARSTCRHADTVLNYLARYTHRIAISNGRLQYLDGDQVVFTYKDYAARGAIRQMHLHAVEFVRRFLLHVLPHGFMRIRHFGFLANCHRRRRLAAIRSCLARPVSDSESTALQETQIQTDIAVPIGVKIIQCPRCKQGELKITGEIKPIRRRHH